MNANSPGTGRGPGPEEHTVTSRMPIAEFVTALDREQGDLHKLFRFTLVDPDQVPAEIEALARRANQLIEQLDATFSRIAEICRYDLD